MYIGPWQEYKLGKLIAQQTELLKQQILSQEQQQLLLPPIFNSDDNPITGLIRSTSKSSVDSLNSIRSAPPERDRGMTYARMARGGSALSSKSSRSDTVSVRKTRQKPTKASRARVLKKQAAERHKSRIENLQNMYRSGQGEAWKDGTDNLGPLASPGLGTTSTKPAGQASCPPINSQANYAGGPNTGSHEFRAEFVSPALSPSTTTTKLPRIDPTDMNYKNPYISPRGITTTRNRTPPPVPPPRRAKTPTMADSLCSSGGLPFITSAPERIGTADSNWEEEADDLLKWTEGIEENEVDDW